jgi:hypothetical protein
MTQVKLERLSYNAVCWIAENMRSEDCREIFATRWDTKPESLATDAMQSYEFGWVAWHGDIPVCAIGAMPKHPGVWSVWMFATDDFYKVALTVTRFARNKMKPVLQSVAHRVECRSIEGHTEAQKWLEFLGMTQESVIPKYGKNGETFLLYSFINSNLP